MSDTQVTEPQGWRPEPGDVLEGVVTGLDKGWSDYKGRFYPIVVVRRADGETVNVHCFHAVLARRMMAIEPGPGDRVKITCHGKRPSRDGKREVTIYTVESDKKQDSGSFWRGIGGGSSPHPAPSPDIPLPDSDDDIPF